MPGDTLAGIAYRYGTTVHALMEQNNLQSPAHIYPGKKLVVDVFWLGKDVSTQRYVLSVGSSFLDISHRASLPWEQLAEVNRVLHPGMLKPGFNMVVPDSVYQTMISPNTFLSPAAVAVANGLPLWTVLQMNPLPVITNESLIVPADEVQLLVEELPFPILGVQVNTQPFIRGTTAQFVISTASPVTCSMAGVDQEIPCYQDEVNTSSSYQYTVLLGIPPLLDPGEYSVSLTVESSEGDSLQVSIPVIISTGRYDFERIDLPADRTALLDPKLSQVERDKIAALRMVRTPERLWTYPFDLPLQGSVTSYYGSRRSYGYGFTSFHAGTDFRAVTGVPVSAPAAGTVALAEPLVVRGNAVIIDHGWGVMSGYWHLSRIDVVVGQDIERGEMIGAVGNTGLSTASHLHWEMWVNGVSVSPLAWLNPDKGLLAGE
jgi:LysM repeat protein